MLSKAVRTVSALGSGCTRVRAVHVFDVPVLAALAVLAALPVYAAPVLTRAELAEPVRAVVLAEPVLAVSCSL